MRLSDTYRTHNCRICGTERDFPTYAVREMMFGTREEFSYFQCDACGCLQIADIPSDLPRHYPSDYYSQHTEPARIESRGVRSTVIKHYCRRIALNPQGLYPRLLQKILASPSDFHEVGEYLQNAQLNSAKDAILDVGCGASPKRLAAMRRCGFGNVLGIDPFLPGDTIYCGVPVKRCRLEDLDGQFSLIMFHHSLEHVPDPLATLKVAARLLRPGGMCLIRIPVMDTFFWREFGCDWAELDAPRHLYLMAPRTVEILADRAGFTLEAVDFDSAGWELAASNLYRNDVPMFERTESGLRSNVAGVSSTDAFRYEQQALALNKAGDAGRARFYLRRRS